MKAEGERAGRHLAGRELQARSFPDLPLRLVKVIATVAYTMGEWVENRVHTVCAPQTFHIPPSSLVIIIKLILQSTWFYTNECEKYEETVDPRAKYDDQRYRGPSFRETPKTNEEAYLPY